MALHRAEFEPLAQLFGDPYKAPAGAELKHIEGYWLPPIRAYLQAELALANQREAALRANSKAKPHI